MLKLKLIALVFLTASISFTACEKENLQSDQPEEYDQIIKKSSVYSDEEVFKVEGILVPIVETPEQRLANPKPFESQLENLYKEPNMEDLK